MLKQHARAVDVGARISDLVGLAVSLPVAYELYERTTHGQEHRVPDRYWFVLVFALRVCAPAFGRRPRRQSPRCLRRLTGKARTAHQSGLRSPLPDVIAKYAPA